MTDKVIYDDDGTRAELDTDLDVIVLTSQPFWKKENTLLLTVKEIDAIHAAIHAGDEPETECANCLYYFRKLNPEKRHPGWGHCRRYAPRSYASERTNEFPTVHANEWCGEYRPKDAK